MKDECKMKNEKCKVKNVRKVRMGRAVQSLTGRLSAFAPPLFRRVAPALSFFIFHFALCILHSSFSAISLQALVPHL
jgi:hypothetical protein